MNNRGTHGRSDNPVHVIDSGVSPHSTVEPETGEDQDSKNAIPRSEAHPSWQVLVHSYWSESEINIKADKESQVITEIHSHKVKEDNP